MPVATEQYGGIVLAGHSSLLQLWLKTHNFACIRQCETVKHTASALWEALEEPSLVKGSLQGWACIASRKVGENDNEEEGR